MKTIFIINPVAGNGNALKKWAQFKKTIDFPYEAVITKRPGYATEYVQELAKEETPYLIIGFGGDGTLREIIAGAAGMAQLAVGSVSAGSGNDFGRGFNCFEKASQISDFLEQPDFAREDLGEFSDGPPRQFVSSSGIGFDAEITVLVNRSHLKRWLNKFKAGKLVYVFYVLKVFMKFEKFGLNVEANGQMQHYEDVWFTTVHNQPYFGGGMKISPHSKTNDGILELTVVHGISRLKLLTVFGTVFNGSHTRFKEVMQMHGEQFLLTTDRPIFRHLDGDDAGKTPANKEVAYHISPQQWTAVNTTKKEDVK